MNQTVKVKAFIAAEKRKARAKGMRWAKQKFYDVLNEFGSLFLSRQRQVTGILEMNQHTSIDFIEGALAYLTRKIKGYRFSTDFSCPLYTVTASYNG